MIWNRVESCTFPHSVVGMIGRASIRDADRSELKEKVGNQKAKHA